MCLGSHALRTKNIHCISRLFAESKQCIWRVFGLALFKNEAYTSCIWHVFGLARFKNEEYTLHLACVWARKL